MTEACAPNPFEGMTARDRKKLECNIDTVVDKVVASVLIKKSPRNLLREVYIAGLYHGNLAANGWSKADD